MSPDIYFCTIESNGKHKNKSYSSIEIKPFNAIILKYILANLSFDKDEGIRFA